MLTGAAVAAAVIDHVAQTADATPEHLHAAATGAPAYTGHAAGAHDWSGGRGTIPTLTDAALLLERRASIIIRDDAAFNPANGVRGGSGTYDDPFVISGWYVDQVLIAETTKAFEFKENYVNNILILDWTGMGGYVHHNHLVNFRTNRNVERIGDPSASVVEKNQIDRVEELRHFDGEVRNNTIGQANALPILRQDVVFNIAGLNGAGIHDNIVYGGVDMKIHGHHHGSATGEASHNHGQADEAQADAREEDHQLRYVDFRFYRNRIIDDGFGMRYNDLNHAGDDRTATSEQEPMLEKPHIHHTTIRIEDNVIEGATMRVAVLNSVDERHIAGETAQLFIHRNRILKPLAGDGIVIQDVRDANIDIRDNVIERGDLQLAGTSAILLQRFTNASVFVDTNTFGAYKYGVRATQFDENTTWNVGANRGAVTQPVYWDDSVANPPQAGADESAHDDGHSHGDGGHGEDDATTETPVRRPSALTRDAGGVLPAAPPV